MILTQVHPRPNESAFDGAERVCDIIPMDTKKGLLALFVSKRAEIEVLINQYIMYEPWKIQLSVEVILEKEKQDGSEEVSTILANCKMVAVDVQGWKTEQFYDC